MPAETWDELGPAELRNLSHSDPGSANSRLSRRHMHKLSRDQNCLSRGSAKQLAVDSELNKHLLLWPLGLHDWLLGTIAMATDD